MANTTVDTFFGQLVQSPVSSGYFNISDSVNATDSNTRDSELSVSSYYYIQFLERKVSILEDIVNTAKLIGEINESLLSAHDQTMCVQLSDVGTQADLGSANHPSVQSISLQTDIQISPRIFEGPETLQTNMPVQNKKFHVGQKKFHLVMAAAGEKF